MEIKKPTKIKKEEEKIEFTDKMDLMSYLAKVHMRIKKDITSDFILAKLGEQDREGIINLTSDAYFNKRLLDILRQRYRIWKWKNGKWKRYRLAEKKRNKIKKIADSMFDNTMVKVNMTALLHRNIDGNFIMKVLAERGDEDKEAEEIKENNAKIKQLLENQEGKEK